jgi:2-haloacid dehalogenase
VAATALVFDLGNVVIEWNPRNLYRKLFADAAEMERFLTDVWTPAWNVKLDAGRAFADGVAELAAQFPAHAAMISAYHERWAETMGDVVPGIEPLLDELAARGHPLYALSNWSAETFPHARARFAVLARFEHIVISGDVGCAKPDTQIYARFLERVGRRAEDCLFIDDVEANVAAALACGFEGVVFRDAAALRAELAARGFL